MTKIVLSDVANLNDTTTAKNVINSNSAIIETASDNTLSRDGTSPNTMQAPIDMNSNRILNLPAPLNGSEPIRLSDANILNGGGTIATFPTGGTTNQALIKASNANFDTTWGNTITSVGLALPADFTITGSPVTTSGTLTGAWATPPTGTGAVVRATSPTLVTPIAAIISGGTVAGSSVTLQSTNNGVPSGDATNLYGSTVTLGNATNNPSTINLNGASGGGVTVNIAAAGNGLNALNVYNNVGSKQSWIPGGGNTTVTFPTATDTLVGKATTDTLTNKTFDTAGAGNSFSINSLAATANTGTGAVVRATSPTLVTPALGTPTSGVATNLTGTASGLTSGNVTTNANLTGPITSVGNATSVASQTGTGSTFVMNTSPALVTPALGTPASGVLTNCTGTASGLTAGNVTTNANLTGQVTSVGNATTIGTNYRYLNVPIVIDGGGVAITTGIKGDTCIDVTGTIDRVTMLADQTGSIVIDIWKDTYANYPPTVADTITASALPTISSSNKSQDSTLTGWTTSVTAGDTLRFNVNSVTTITRVTLILRILRT